MLSIVQSCLMHEEAYVLTTFFPCLLLWLAVLRHLPFLRGSRAVCGGASHCLQELLLFREKNSAKHEKDIMPQNIPQPNQRVTGRDSCLTACIKGWLNSAEIFLPCTFHPKTRISWPQLLPPQQQRWHSSCCCSPGLQPLSRELLQQPCLRREARRRRPESRLESGNRVGGVDMSQCLAWLFSCSLGTAAIGSASLDCILCLLTLHF